MLLFIEIKLDDVGLLWAPALHKLLNVKPLSRCFIFVRQASLPLPPIQLPEGATMCNLTNKEDIMLTRNRNKIPFDLKYVEDGCHISSGVRVNGDLAANAFTHRDSRVLQFVVFKVSRINIYFFPSACWCASCVARVSP